jgi:hypothetical protein
MIILPRDIKSKVLKAERLALDARNLAEQGNQADAQKLRVQHDELFYKIYELLDRQGGCYQLGMVLIDDAGQD